MHRHTQSSIDRLWLHTLSNWPPSFSWPFSFSLLQHYSAIWSLLLSSSPRLASFHSVFTTRVCSFHFSLNCANLCFVLKFTLFFYLPLFSVVVAVAAAVSAESAENWSTNKGAIQVDWAENAMRAWGLVSAVSVLWALSASQLAFVSFGSFWLPF